jgi:hypothetical protein
MDKHIKLSYNKDSSFKESASESRSSFNNQAFSYMIQLDKSQLDIPGVVPTQKTIKVLFSQANTFHHYDNINNKAHDK